VNTSATNKPKKQSRRGCCLTCLMLSFISLILICLASGLIYFWMQEQELDVDILRVLIQRQRGEISEEELMSEMTKAMGTGQITILNFSDEDGWVTITNKEERSGGSNTIFNELRPFDMQSKAKLPGTYEAQFRLDFDGFGEKPPALATCVFALERDNNYQFIILNDRVLLVLEGDESGNDLDAIDSILCHQGEGKQ